MSVLELLTECNVLLETAERIDTSVELISCARELRLRMSDLAVTWSNPSYFEEYISSLKDSVNGQALMLERVLAQYDVELRQRMLLRARVKLLRKDVVRNMTASDKTLCQRLLLCKDFKLIESLAERAEQITFKISEREMEWLSEVHNYG